jgi:hypothetical protein
MTGKRRRRLRIKANHERLRAEYTKWWLANDGWNLTYEQWLHPHMRRLAEDDK